MKKSVRNESNVIVFLLVLGGLLLLLENFGFVQGISKFWPVTILILGIGLLMLSRNQKDIGIIWLGSCMAMLSLFFFYLNFTSWKQLAKLWPIFMAIFGLSFLPCYFKKRKKMLIIISIFAILLSASFILIFILSVKLWPISLIIAAIFLYLASRCNK